MKLYKFDCEEGSKNELNNNFFISLHLSIISVFYSEENKI